MAEVKSFLDAGGDVETFGGRFHGTLLLESCRFHTAEVADLLLERGAAVKVSGGGSWTPLHYACDGQEASSLVATLIRHHASVHAADFYGRTPLHMASRQGSSNAALALLEAGANPNVPDKDRRTPLHYASFHGHRNVIAVLFSFGGDVSSLDRELSTPLHMATLMRRSIVKNLLERVGADVNAVDCWGRLAGTLAPSYKMRLAANDKIDRHQGADESARGKHDNEGASSRKCVACSATKGRHYYFCRSETLHGMPEHLILGPDGLSIAERK